MNTAIASPCLPWKLTTRCRNEASLLASLLRRVAGAEEELLELRGAGERRIAQRERRTQHRGPWVILELGVHHLEGRGALARLHQGQALEERVLLVGGVAPGSLGEVGLGLLPRLLVELRQPIEEGHPALGVSGREAHVVSDLVQRPRAAQHLGGELLPG